MSKENLKRKTAFLLLFFLVLSIIPFQYAAGDIKVGGEKGETLHLQPVPIPVWALGSDFRVLTPNPSCVPALGLEDRLVAFYVNSTTSLRVEVSLYLSCPNVSGPEIRLPPNVSPEVEGFTRYIKVKPPEITHLSKGYTKVVVPVDVFTTLPYPFPLELRSRNLSVYYSVYNSTYLLVRVVFSNLTVSPEMKWTLGYSEPSHYGLPDEIRLSYLVNRYTGGAYLLDNGTKRYIGTLPLYLPEFNVEYYLRGIQKRTDELVKTIESNPWIVEDIINKAKRMNSTYERNELLSGAALNFTRKIFENGHLYLGIPFNLTVGENLYTISPYVEFHRILPLPQVNDDFGFSERDKNLTKSAVEEYLRLNKTEKLMKLLGNAIKVRRFVTPSLSTNTFVSVSLPLQPGDMLPLPLPANYRKELNATYIYTYIPHNAKGYLHVEYDSRVFDPNRTVEEWRTAVSFITLLRNEVAADISSFLRSSMASGRLNYTALSRLQSRVSSEVISYLKNLSPTSAESTSSTASAPAGTAPQQKEPLRKTPSAPNETSKPEKNSSICGPAMPVGLSLIAAVFGRR